MTRSFWVSVFFLCTWAVTAAQVMPVSDGGCGVSPTGAMSCDWLSAVPDRARVASQEEYNALLKKSQTGVFVTRFSMAPGAPLTLPMANYDALVVGLSDGPLVNETAKPPSSLKVSKGSVMLVPKNERITLRNNSGHDLELVVIENRHAQSNSN